MDLDCPILVCDEDFLEPGVCYRHDGKASSNLIKGALCYDVESAGLSDQVMVCPFNTNDFMWLDERLQGQRRNSNNMCYSDTSQIEEKQ